MNKHEQNSELTRNKLTESFWELYKKNDISKITISMICKNANYDRTTFYRYFFDISEVLRKIEDTVIDGIRDSIVSSNNSIDIPKLKFNNFKSFNDKYGEYIITFHDKGNRGFYLKFKELIKNYVFEYFDLKVHNEEKKEFLFEFMFSSLINSYAYWYHNQKMMDLESFAKLANNMVIHGSQIVLDSIK